MPPSSCIDHVLSRSRDEDVSKSMYKDTIRSADHTAPSIDQTGEPSSSKVNRICNAFLDALETRTSTHFQNVVTAHVCKIPPDLDAGLKQIAELKSKHSKMAMIIIAKAGQIRAQSWSTRR